MTYHHVRFVRSPLSLYRSFAGEVLIGTPEGADRLEGTAAHVWELLGAPRTVPELGSVLGESYAAPREVIEADVGALLDDLVGRGWVEEVYENDG